MWRNREKQAGVLHTGSGPRPTLKMLPREVPIPGGEDRPVVREPAKIARFPLWLQAKRWGCHVRYLCLRPCIYPVSRLPGHRVMGNHDASRKNVRKLCNGDGSGLRGTELKTVPFQTFNLDGPDFNDMPKYQLPSSILWHY